MEKTVSDGPQATLLRQKVDALRSRGALGIGISFAPLDGETVESVCASPNEALDLVARGDYEELSPNEDRE